MKRGNEKVKEKSRWIEDEADESDGYEYDSDDSMDGSDLSEEEECEEYEDEINYIKDCDWSSTANKWLENNNNSENEEEEEKNKKKVEIENENVKPNLQKKSKRVVIMNESEDE